MALGFHETRECEILSTCHCCNCSEISKTCFVIDEGNVGPIASFQVLFSEPWQPRTFLPAVSPPDSELNPVVHWLIHLVYQRPWAGNWLKNFPPNTEMFQMNSSHESFDEVIYKIKENPFTYFDLEKNIGEIDFTFIWNIFLF